MQLLPTKLTTSQVNELLSSIEKLPSAIIKRTSYSVMVFARQKSNGAIVPVLDAVTLDNFYWNVHAAPGIISMNVESKSVNRK